MKDRCRVFLLDLTYSQAGLFLLLLLCMLPQVCLCCSQLSSVFTGAEREFECTGTIA